MSKLASYINSDKLWMIWAECKQRGIDKART